jgi:hypothetical protein
MIDMPNKENREKVASIIALYNHTFSEIVRYRDLEWKITAWSIGLLAGVVAVIKWFDFETIPCGFRTLITIFSITTAVYCVWHIHFVHKQLTIQRQKRRDIEKLLGFFTPGRYDTNSLLPEKWDKENIHYSDGIFHLLSWWALIITASSAVIYYIYIQK